MVFRKLQESSYLSNMLLLLLLSRASRVRPRKRQPTRLPLPWDSPGKNTGVGCPFSLHAWKWKVKVKLNTRVRLSDPTDCSLPGSSVHGIFQARVLEWVAIAFSTNMLIKRQNDDQEAKWWGAIRHVMVAALTGLSRLWKDFEWGEKALKGFDREVI